MPLFDVAVVEAGSAADVVSAVGPIAVSVVEAAAASDVTAESLVWASVMCTYPNGMTLYLFTANPNDDSPLVPGVKYRISFPSSSVTLSKGSNIVDSHFWNSWKAANLNNDFLTNGTIFEQNVDVPG